MRIPAMETRQSAPTSADKLQKASRNPEKFPSALVKLPTEAKVTDNAYKKKCFFSAKSLAKHFYGCKLIGNHASLASEKFLRTVLNQLPDKAICRG
ncbi:MAG: hypothetical protein IKS83_06535 [Victivallales bacterium]|nr:hypothetical protein [Victivallales bacterium]